jgi:hypothetical protein
MAKPYQADDDEADSAFPSLRLHPLIWTVGLLLTFVAALSASVIAIWPESLFWFEAMALGFVTVAVVVVIWYQRERHE